MVGLSAITVAELEFGDAAKPNGALRKVLQTRGTPTRPLDFLIAAHAIALKATPVTNYTGEFLRVPGLTLEEWSMPS